MNATNLTTPCPECSGLLCDVCGDTCVLELWSDARARTVASWWSSFNRTPCPLYKLQSTGYIDGATGLFIVSLRADVQDSVVADNGTDWTHEDVLDLSHLLAYVRHHGHRQPVAGWDALWDDQYEAERSDEE